MINTFAQIDHLASAGRTPWHRASAIGKLLFAILMLALVVFCPRWPLAVALFASALLLALLARVPVRLVLAAAATPLFFTGVFAFAQWHGDVGETLEHALRPMAASLTALWLVATTPYPDLFAPLSRVLPQPLGDGLFLSYRAVFSLLERVERLWRALWLRGATRAAFRTRFETMGEAVGTLVLHGFERSDRMYRAMLLRGHSGRICGCRHYREFAREDAWVAGAAVWVAGLAIALWRTW